MNYTQIHYIQIIRFIMYISTFKCQKNLEIFSSCIESKKGVSKELK